MPRKKSSVVEENPEVVPGDAVTENQLHQRRIRIGDYAIALVGNQEKTEYTLLSDADAIVGTGTFRKQVLEYPGLVSSELTADKVALREAIQKYNELFPLTSGEIDIDRLVPHSHNKMIYPGENSAFPELVRVMREGAEVDELVVLPRGEVLRGNTRLQAALTLNQEAELANAPIPYKKLKAKVIDLEGLESELEYIRQGNIYRSKSKEDEAREAAIAVRNLVVKSRGEKIELDALKKVKSEIKMSPRNIDNLVVYEKARPTLSPKLRKSLDKIKTASPDNVAKIVKVEAPEGSAINTDEYREAIANAIVKSDKPLSFKAAKQIVDNSLSDQAIGSSLTPVMQEALSLGDIPKDNRYTPDKLVEIAVAALDGIDIDAFATMTNAGKIPATKAYTIKHDAFKQELSGKIFACPPFSVATDCAMLMDSWLRKGAKGISKLFLILPIEAFGSKGVHTMIRDLDMMVCYPSDRLSFAPGELLQVLEPDSKAEERPVVILFYSDQEHDYSLLTTKLEEEGWWCGRTYEPVDISEANLQSVEPEIEEENLPL